MIKTALCFFIVGWVSMGMSLFDVGHYSFPLIFFATIPFILRANLQSGRFLLAAVVSSIFSICVGLLEHADTSHVLSQAFLQFLALLFAAGVASIDWTLHLETLAHSVITIGIPVVIFGGYQMVARVKHLPLAFLPVTNKQYYIDGGLQRDWDKPNVTRASSFFSEPSEFGLFCLWLLALGFSATDRRLRALAIGLGCAGILFSQSLSAVVGALLLILVYLLTNPISIQTLRQIVIMLVVAICSIGAMGLVAPEATDQLATRITQAATFDERADSGRVDHLPACWRIFTESPVWGHGISSMSAASADGSDVTTVNYAMVLMERGILGAALFFLPWFAVAGQAILLPRETPGRQVALMLMVTTLYSFCDFSLTYLLPFWLALGIAASVVRPTHSLNPQAKTNSLPNLHANPFPSHSVGKPVTT